MKSLILSAAILLNPALDKVPVEDFASIHITKKGEIIYQDIGDVSDYNPIYASDADAYTLHSNPNAPHTIYLNFKGKDLSDTKWAEFDPNPPTIAQAYPYADSYVYTIWKKVMEDFVPFDVDITTEQPLTEFYGEVIITKKLDTNGDCIYSCNWGGVAYVGDFGITPAIVYYDNISSPANQAEAASHEVGHLLGLHHDGRKGGNKQEYYRGGGNWAPIMGVSYNTAVTQWNNGTYKMANNLEDDIAIIADTLGYAADVEGSITSIDDVEQFEHYTDTPIKMIVDVPANNLNVEILIDDIIYNPRGELKSYVVLQPGPVQFVISGGPDISFPEYGSLGRYKINFEPHSGFIPEVTYCDSIVSTTSPGAAWYIDGQLVAVGTSYQLNKNDGPVLLITNEGQRVIRHDLQNYSVTKSCK